tara:strand:- start:750 stop:1979 length:1230 start_codon:yes stop_codon:yes gene_type:complete
MPKVNVKGYGNVNFPNGMDVNDIRDTLRRRYSDQTNSDLLQSASKYGAPTGSVAAPYKPSLMERAGQGVADVLSDTGIISNRYGAQQIGKNVANIGEMLPGIGDVAAVDDFSRAAASGDNLGMGLAALGVLPVAGDLAGKAGKAAVDVASSIKPIMSNASKFIPENIKDFTVKKGYQPSETVKAYKLFKTKPGDDNIYPLFVNSNDKVDVGKWVDAEIGEIAEKGSKRKSSTKPSDKPMVKSSLGNLAFRPGWHAGDAASAQHIGGKAVKGSKKPQYRPANQVWAEVEMPNDVNWQDEATKRADIKKDGNVNARTAHITDQLPLGGSYRYKTNSNMQGSWIISGNMKVNNKLNNEQVKGVGLSTGIPDLPILPDYLEANKGLKESDLTEVAIKELRSSYPDYYKSRFNK